jgi:RHS repeat-associated protein
VDRSGQTLLREYDSVGRLHQITYPDSSTIIYGYDGDGRPVTVQDSMNGTIERTYDGLSRLTSETTPQGSLSYTYDAVGRATMTVTGDPTVEYEYDAAGRLETVTQGTAVVSLEYDDANRRTSLTLPNGVVTEYGYDAASQLTALTYRSGPTVLGNLTYTYDLDGRRSEVGGTLARTSLPQSVATAAYDNANQLTQWASRILSYDMNGNVRSDGYSDFIWNTRQQLVGLGGGASGAFGYDSEGRRTQRTVGLTTASYLYAGQDTVREQITNGPTATRLAGENVDEWWSRTEPAGQHAPLVDAQGSAIALADASGTLVTHYTYEPFGRTTTSGASTPNRFAFTGRETDQDALAGLYYYRARYYDSALGRFVSTDPLGMTVGMNSYEYVENDPLNATDPTGLYSLKGFPPARHAQMRRAIRDLYTRLKQVPCCIEPSLRDRVLQLIHPGENGSGVTFQYRNVIPVPGRRRGVVVCGLVGGLGDFFSNAAQISRAAMAYAAAEACFGPACSRVTR